MHDELYLTNISLKLEKELSNLKEFTLFYFIQILYLIYSYIGWCNKVHYIYQNIYEERLVLTLQIYCLVFTFPYIQKRPSILFLKGPRK